MTLEQADQLRSALLGFELEHGIDVLIHGACPHPIIPPKSPQRDRFSADMVADEWAKSRGIKVEAYPVRKHLDGDWPMAGPNRNSRMIGCGKPTHGIAGHGGDGTADCARKLKAKRVPVNNLADKQLGLF